ncbi:MAG: biotin transporter BioY [Clostridiales bacterium]|nr:biotin transporter BioY [Clostridiales bacterium]
MGNSEVHTKIRKDGKTADLVQIALFAVLIAVCSWITIPAQIPFTLQTLAIFTALGILGGKKGTIAIAIYILLGAVGIPVFSNFRGGIGVLAGATGGYILGFILTGLIYWGITAAFRNIRRSKCLDVLVVSLAMIIGNLVCYAAGTVHYMMIYAKNAGGIGVGAALSLCVLPFILPDLVKIGIAVFISKFSSLSRRFGSGRTSRHQDR